MMINKSDMIEMTKGENANQNSSSNHSSLKKSTQFMSKANLE